MQPVLITPRYRARHARAGEHSKETTKLDRAVRSIAKIAERE
jgi:hypothetical protein